MRLQTSTAYILCSTYECCYTDALSPLYSTYLRCCSLGPDCCSISYVYTNVAMTGRRKQTSMNRRLSYEKRRGIFGPEKDSPPASLSWDESKTSKRRRRQGDFIARGLERPEAAAAAAAPPPPSSQPQSQTAAPTTPAAASTYAKHELAGRA